MSSPLSKFGTKKYQGKLNTEDEGFISRIMPVYSESIKRAENDPTRFGVRSVKVGSKKEADKVLTNSIYNNYVRWTESGKPGGFIDFMWKRWAPVGAKNDPKGLNKNWGPNVRSIINKVLIEQYGPKGKGQ